MNTNRRQYGFTLIELVIVISAISILAGFAIASYKQYITRANRSAAQEFLLYAASQSELFRLDTRNYPTAIGDQAGELNLVVPGDVDGHYNITLNTNNSITPPLFTLTATPVSGGAQENDGALSVNSLGIKTPTDKW